MSILTDSIYGDVAANEQWPRSPYGLKLKQNPADSFKTLKELQAWIVEKELKGSPEEASYVQNIANILDADSTKVAGDNITYDETPNAKWFYSNLDYSDTRVGGNDAINPYWQFNEDDDITSNLSAIEAKKHDTRGMGRVYSETYNKYQQILWMSMGVAEYSNILSFYMDAGDINASRAMNRGTLRNIVGTLIRWSIKAVLWAITFPVMAPLSIVRWMQRLDSDRISKYFTFKPSMPIYYEMVNTLLSYLASSMGLYSPLVGKRRDSTKALQQKYNLIQEMETGKEAKENKTLTVDEAMKRSNTEIDKAAPAINTSQSPKSTSTVVSQAIIAADSRESGSYVQQNTGSENYQGNAANDPNGQQVYFEDAAAAVKKRIAGNRANLRDNTSIPKLLEHGPDIYLILNRRARLYNGDEGKFSKITTRQLLQHMVDDNGEVSGDRANIWATPNPAKVRTKDGTVQDLPSKEDVKHGFWNKAISSLKGGMFGSGDYVGFKIEKGVNCTETISSSTGPTSMAQKLNSHAQQQREAYENYGNSWVAKTAASLMKGPADFLKDISTQLLGSAVSMFGMGDIGAIMTQGNGFLDLPDVWKGSSFQRSFNFNIQLRSRYGDPISIFQSIYIPLAMLLCAALPRAIGNSMYTAPFYVKCYCKGMFCIPCGIITSLSITRGGDDFGWTDQMLPTKVDVSLTIQDLTPTFFLAMQDIGLFDTFSRNDNLMEYLDTLSALGLAERVCYWPRMMRKLSAALAIKKNTIFNPYYWGYTAGMSTLARSFSAISPFYDGGDGYPPEITQKQ